MEGTGYKTLQQNGEYGNYCAAVSEITADATAADTEINWLKLPPGTLLIGARLVGDDLGASLQLGYRYLDDAAGTSSEDGLIAAGATGTLRGYEGMPIKFDEAIAITSKITGGAATGNAACIVEYIYCGTP